MTRKRPIYVGTLEFSTKTELQDYIRAVVARYGDEEPLTSGDLAFVSALLARHPQADIKIGAGIGSIIVRRNPVYRQTRGFHVLRVDGTDTDFSWVECLSPTPHPKKVIRALRVLVEPQTMAFKRRFFDDLNPHYCALTGKPISFVGSHVDHVPPLTFERLVGDFCEVYGFDLDTVPLRDAFADNKYVDVLDDDLIAIRWTEYHAANAQLRVISQFANLSIAKTEVQP